MTQEPPEEPDKDSLYRRVCYWLGQSESALDMSMAALTRVGELSPEWAEEFSNDWGVIRSKLDTIRELITKQS